MIWFIDLRPRQWSGVSRILPLGNITSFEKKLIDAALPELVTNIEKVPFLPPFLQKRLGDLINLIVGCIVYRYPQVVKYLDAVERFPVTGILKRQTT